MPKQSAGGHELMWDQGQFFCSKSRRIDYMDTVAIWGVDEVVRISGSSFQSLCLLSASESQVII